MVCLIEPEYMLPTFWSVFFIKQHYCINSKITFWKYKIHFILVSNIYWTQACFSAIFSIENAKERLGTTKAVKVIRQDLHLKLIRDEKIHKWLAPCY